MMRQIKLRRYAVLLTNLQTGEWVMREVEAGHPAEAQDMALRLQFHQYGWRRTRAGVPEVR